jgi:cytochrome c oxidase assembly protein subunit 15
MRRVMTTRNPAHRPIVLWLALTLVLIAAMVIVGGATRLTDSGLSITEWDPIIGALPPMGEQGWAEAFALYKQIPEYGRVNYGMSLDEFKFIYWWEWGHRNLGRVIGLVMLLPLVVFSVTGRVRGGLRWRLWGLFGLVCLQGAIGWYMVSSGLSERVDVSQYRLALHLSTALLLFALVLWQLMALVRDRGFGASGDRWLPRLSVGLLAALSVQIVLGAFVAGLRAGKSYNSWPLMEGEIVPTGYWREGSGLLSLFETIEAVQFNHRTFAYVVVALAVAVTWRAWKAGLRPLAIAVGGSVALQFSLGVWALLAAVPLWLGLAHQAGALLVLGAAVTASYAVTPHRTAEAGPLSLRTQAA